jgi:hypothetical protein
MTRAQNQLERLIKIFEKTFIDKRFSRAEKKAVTRLLEEDYLLNKSQRDYLKKNLIGSGTARNLLTCKDSIFKI